MSPDSRRAPLELSVIIPTLNERDNVEPLLARLDAALQGVGWEAIFVDDDSRDGTADRIRAISRHRPEIRVLQRIGRRGLTSACTEGMMASSAPYLAVIDADLQHDESLLPKMLETARSQKLDIVIASRNVGDGGMGDFAASRVRLSNAGKWLSNNICRIPLQDPMSGFFLVDQRFIHEVVRGMSGVSFKVLVDMVSSSTRPVRFVELPYSFRNRLHGESKLDVNTLFEYGVLIAHKLIRGVVPARFVLFTAVGMVGMLLHLATLAALLESGTSGFLRAQATATAVAMVSNFWLNNIFTFRDRKLRGWRLLTGALSFCVTCAIGGLSSVALGDWLFRLGAPWYLAGVAGAAVAAVWNFAVSSIFTWPERRRTPVAAVAVLPETSPE